MLIGCWAGANTAFSNSTADSPEMARSHGVQELLDALVEENLLSDERFTESFVRFRVQRYQGPLKIKAALRTKGVPIT